jgi:hypothetical protein
MAGKAPKSQILVNATLSNISMFSSGEIIRMRMLKEEEK